ncbi:hypothetical protein FRB94_002847 [Tulasnella sp. JGI-2019a]|nr:hypothetical protein FRB94_002847 [Tulasnella sp. JGI-2019a]
MLESRTGWCGPVWSGRTLTPATAAALWKQYIQPLKITHPNLKLTSPAVTNGGAPSGIAWLYSLFACEYRKLALEGRVSDIVWLLAR